MNVSHRKTVPAAMILLLLPLLASCGDRCQVVSLPARIIVMGIGQLFPIDSQDPKF